jgi:hypothetical protein
MSNTALKRKGELRDRKQQDGQNCIMRWTGKVATMTEMRNAYKFWPEILKESIWKKQEYAAG